jgi:hypothetical protein
VVADAEGMNRRTDRRIRNRVYESRAQSDRSIFMQIRSILIIIFITHNRGRTYAVQLRYYDRQRAKIGKESMAIL